MRLQKLQKHSWSISIAVIKLATQPSIAWRRFPDVEPN